MDDVSDGERTGAEPVREALGAMTLYPRPESVPQARRWFRKFLAPNGLVRPLDDCLLMLSELVTNAVLHGRAPHPWRVRVEWWRQGQALGVEVHSPGPPEAVLLRAAGGHDPNGRGLHLVEALADSWSVGPSRYGGNAVTFTLADAWPPAPPRAGSGAPGPAPAPPSFHEPGEVPL